MKPWIKWLPFLAFVACFLLFRFSLMHPTNSTVPSKQIGRALPDFHLEPALSDMAGLSTTDFKDGHPHFLNIFASWCLPCAEEGASLMALHDAGIPVMAIAVRDRAEDITRFLNRHGNPYQAIGQDQGSHVQIAIGSSGVPESFLIDGQGIIRYQHIGPITEQDLPQLMTIWRQLPS
ncbi:MAG: redoxin family protein [Zymomonas mobilis subsp. pomaceae]|uniref:Redoxin domain protein n=1 Tax=Zymomonas mobilis subsp. pomaceae (strain ATCC 29192 / DSM 22645 / JCM 10191 / CCUG 17912 / NBRC 13757 / NCIMB 11200 / NRRL B-4491 / Barker I) TaxID=579138 RepID=F8ET77_ZYMMT|nr:redoxin family protein [Zymomonas mobilis]AEI36967.1 Redoxin domain protein [Zymomonas mobilis subsp. pomaceae ATCC 29192]MDX5948340.1 redoxin family protein [Zymomonas mobilis subsp. pomaceae]GEB89096.1 thiol:disulfide interchange protein [Zymomonas mobilis subsp. pomaceae]